MQQIFYGSEGPPLRSQYDSEPTWYDDDDHADDDDDDDDGDNNTENQEQRQASKQAFKVCLVFALCRLSLCVV